MMEALLLVGGLVLLFGGAEAFVRGSASLGQRLGMTPVAVGLTVVAFGTSAPELVVSLRAALLHYDDIAVGNVVGSNICNLGLVLGLCAAIRPVSVHARLLRLDLPLVIGISLVLCGLLADGELERSAGAVFLATIAAYTASSIRRARRETWEVRRQFSDATPGATASPWLDLLLVALGLAGLLAGAHCVVNAAAGIAETLGVGRAVIGLTVVALGTSLPELATSLVAAVRGNGDIAVGNVVGSNLFNILGILGVTSLVHPVSSDGVHGVDLGVMVGVAALLFLLMGLGPRIERSGGAALLAVYGAYLLWLLA
jgi:cation:H+ antiporter